MKEKRPTSWFGPPDRPRKTRVIKRAVRPNSKCAHKLRKQFYKNEIALSERLHQMGYARRHIMDVLGFKSVSMVNLRLENPWKLNPKDILGLATLLQEDFMDVMYEVACECRDMKSGYFNLKKAREHRLKKVVAKHPRSASTEYKGKSLGD